MVRLSQYEYEREQLWLLALEEYQGQLTLRGLAAITGISPGHLSRRIARAKRLRANPAELFGIEWLDSPNAFATHGCERHNEIQIGDLRGCLACGLTGIDHQSPFRGVAPLLADLRVPDAPKPKPTRRERRKALASGR
jgi:hypothetical protein